VPGPRVLFVLALVVALALAWKLTPLGDYVTLERMIALAERVRELPASPLLVIAAFIVAGLLVVPLTLMVVATTIAFGPVEGGAYALGGARASALVGYAIGRRMGREALGRHAARAAAAIEERVAGGGVLSVATLRLLPVAPFTLVNLVAGAARLRVPAFLAGSLLGFVPGIAAIAFATDRAGAALAQPGAATFGVLGAVLIVMFAAAALLRRKLLRPTPSEAGRR
jgi:uncharacterized membrane protein YdjX (TVP38/TMEM64 family)